MIDDDDNLAVLDFWPDGKVLEAYYQCWAENTLIMGPYGSGKSKTTAAKLLDAICMIPPTKAGVRRSRSLVTRNYEADLITTTMEDWRSILPGAGEGYTHERGSAPILHQIEFDGWDGIPVEAELEFLPLNDEKEAQKKLKGKEYTFGWFNECGEQKASIVTVARGRIGGRYPAHQDMPDIPINAAGDRYWSGAFYDTNPPDDEHWVHQVIETPTYEQTLNWRTFVQPPGAIKNPENGRWEPNPLAENQKNLSPSYYASRIANALSEDWLRINIGNEYGTTLSGVPVWSNYSQGAHETETLDYDRSIPVFAGLDYGRTPAMSMWQKRGDVYLMFDEFTSVNMSAELFGPACRQFLWEKWQIRAADVQVFDDPAGGAKSQATEDTPRQIMRASGFSRIQAAPCEANNITVRRKAMMEPLGRLSMNGRACVQIHKRCKTARKGASGKFYFRKLEVSYDSMYTDAPVKNHYSHICFAPGTMIDTPRGQVPVESLREDDMVNTPIGPRRVTARWERAAERVRVVTNEGATVCTPDHPFHTLAGYKPACLLKPGESIAWDTWGWSNHWKCLKFAKDVRDTLSTSFKDAATTAVEALRTITPQPIQGRWSTCTEQSGSITTGLFPSGTISTTRTAIQPTIDSATSNASQDRSMYPCTCDSLKGWKAAGRLSSWHRRPQCNGDAKTPAWPQPLARKALQATRQHEPQRHQWPSVARIVVGVLSAMSTVTKPLQQRASATIAASDVCQQRVGQVAWTTSLASVLCAALDSLRTGTAANRHVVVSAVEPWQSGTVIGITVDDAHAYYANGMLVSNCESMEYALVGQGEGFAWLASDVKQRMAGRQRKAMIAHNQHR